MTIAVGSTNPAKLSAVQEAFKRLGIQHSIVSSSAPSGVSDQPKSDGETLHGAINRAKHVVRQGHVRLGVGLEGGVDETSCGMVLCNWCAIVDEQGSMGIGAGVRILLPTKLADEIRRGHELGDAIDVYTGQSDVRKGEGTIGILTNGLISRSQMFQDAVICAYTSMKLFQ